MATSEEIASTIAQQQADIVKLRVQLQNASTAYPWIAADITPPKALTDAANAVKTITTTVTQILDVVSNILQLIKALDTAIASPTAGLLKSALAALDTVLTSLQQSANVYLLVVPPQLPDPVGPYLKQALDSTGIQLENQFSRGLTGGIRDTLLYVPQLAESLPLMRAAQGGNPGFARTVLESLYDEGDSNRPQLKDTDYVVSLYLVGFSKDPTEVLRTLKLISLLFGDKAPETMYPRPQDLRLVKAEPGVQLSWAAQPATFTLNQFAGYKVTRVAIARTTDVGIQRTTNPYDLFAHLTVGEKDVTGNAEIIAVFDHANILQARRYYDRTELVEGKTYYYAAWFEITSPAPTAIIWTNFSNWVRYYKDAAATAKRESSAGVSPDWIHPPNLLSTFEVLDQPIKDFKQFSARAKAEIDNTSSQISDYIDQIVKEGQYYQKRVADVNKAVKRIADLVSAAQLASVNLRIAHGSGGNRFVVSDVNAAFNNPDPADTYAPRYFNGELYAGIVILAAGPGPAVLAPVLSFLEALFGGAGQVVSQFQQIITSIDGIATAAENKTVSTTTTTTRQSLSAIKIGADDPGNCADITKTVQFGDNLAPV